MKRYLSMSENDEIRQRHSLVHFIRRDARETGAKRTSRSTKSLSNISSSIYA